MWAQACGEPEPEPPGDPSGTCFSFRQCGSAADGTECGTCDDGITCTQDRCVGGYLCRAVRTRDHCKCTPDCSRSNGHLRREAAIWNGAGGLDGFRGPRDVAVSLDGRFVYAISRRVHGTRALVDGGGRAGGGRRRVEGGSGDGALAIFERLDNGLYLRDQLPIHDARSLLIQPSSGRLFVGDKDVLFSAGIRASDGALTVTGCPEASYGALALAATPDWLAATNGETLRLYSAADCPVQVDELIVAPTALRFSPDGRFLYAAFFSSSTLRGYEVTPAGLVTVAEVSNVPGLDRPDALAVTGSHVYTTSFCGGAIGIFGRGADGDLTPLDPVGAPLGPDCPNALDHIGAGGGVRQGPDNRQNSEPSLGNPGALTVTSAGELWVSLRFGLMLERYTIDGDSLKSIAEIDLVPTYSDFAPGGFGAEALLGFPEVMSGWTRLVTTGDAVYALSYLANTLTLLEDATVQAMVQQGDGGVGRLGGAYNLDLSPDGRHVYVAARNEGEPAGFTLGDDGRLTPIQSPPTGVRAEDGSLTNVVVVRPGGEQVYAVDSQGGGVQAYDRHADTGALSARASLALAACDGKDPFPVDIVSHPDGHTLYVADFQVDGLSCLHVLSRSPSGELVLRKTHDDPILRGIEAIALTSDARYAYTAAHISGAVTRWLVADDGALSSPAPYEEPALEGAEVVVVAPDDNTVYATSPVTNSLLVLDVDDAGRLSKRQLISGDADQLKMEEAAGIAVTPDGRFVYLASRTSDTINAFAVDDAGLLSPLQVVLDPEVLDWSTGVLISNNGEHLLVTSVLSSAISVWSIAVAGKDGCGGLCP